MQLSYKILFVVEVLHDYYSDARCADFTIEPTAETQLLFKNQQILWRNMGNKFYALVRLVEGKPLVPLSPDLVFRCYLKLNGMQFANFTNIEVNYSAGQRLYLTNLHQHHLNGTRFITQQIAAYNGATSYLPGSFAQHVNGDVYEAIRSSNNGNAHALNESTFWENRLQQRYATPGDLTFSASNLFRFQLPAPVVAASIDVFRFNTANGNYDLPALPNQVLNFPQNQSEVLVNLGSLPPARYRVQVNAESAFVYADSRIQQEQVFGMVEIFNHLPAANQSSLLNNDGTVKETVFTVRFANRVALWKYLVNAGSAVTAIKDSNGTYSFVKSGDAFISNRPIPLTETPIRSFFLESGNAGPPFALSNAAINRIRTLQRDGDTFYCSEIFLNQ